MSDSAGHRVSEITGDTTTDRGARGGTTPLTDTVREVAKPSRRRAESRRRLIEAAREVFLDRGIRDTPVEAICERAGFTRGAFYSNFATKEDLFLAVFEQEMALRRTLFAAALDQAARAPGAEGGTVHAIFAAVAQLYVATVTGGTGESTRTVDENAWFVLITEFRLQGMRQPELRERVGAALDAVYRSYEEVIAEFLDRIGLTLTIPLDHAVRSLLALVDAALEDDVFANRSTDLPNPFRTSTLPLIASSLVAWPS